MGQIGLLISNLIETAIFQSNHNSFFINIVYQLAVGCKNKISIMKKDSKEAFVLKAKSVHSDKYDYSKVEYKNSKGPTGVLETATPIPP